MRQDLIINKFSLQTGLMAFFSAETREDENPAKNIGNCCFDAKYRLYRYLRSGPKFTYPDNNLSLCFVKIYNFNDSAEIYRCFH